MVTAIHKCVNDECCFKNFHRLIIVLNIKAINQNTKIQVQKSSCLSI